ncbi:MAG TPA: hypothetical protein PKA64_09000 [Myxococcota bacterium]|nr:hypothetical protein [Myxococcota bacterium]
MRLPLLALCAALAGSCAAAVGEQFESCTLEVAPASEHEVAAGDAYTLIGGPQSTPWDSRVQVGGVRADVLDIAREGCGDCDACRASEDCGACGACDACDAFCDGCTESLTFRVPALDEGTWDVVLLNRYGTSLVTRLTIPPAAADDTDAGDTDPSDTDGGDTDPADTDDTDPSDTAAPGDTASEAPSDTDAAP